MTKQDRVHIESMLLQVRSSHHTPGGAWELESSKSSSMLIREKERPPARSKGTAVARWVAEVFRCAPLLSSMGGRTRGTALEGRDCEGLEQAMGARLGSIGVMGRLEGLDVLVLCGHGGDASEL